VKKQFLYLITCFLLTGAESELFAQTCFVKKINNERIHEPLWTGPCKDSLATGEGILYDGWNKMRYRGEMQIGLPQGYGAWYGKYSIDGTWAKGKPVNAGYYLREVRFNEEGTYAYTDNGLRYLLNKNKGLTTEALNMPEKLDTNGFSKRLSEDNTYVPFPEKKKKKNAILPPDYYASSIFYLDESGGSGTFTSTFYKRFLVRCKQSGDWYVLYFKESFGKGTQANIWLTEPFEKTNARKYYSARDALQAMCSCD
jgi:hypothetical protein